jgi:uncharacterized protein (DUF169 family)
MDDLPTKIRWPLQDLGFKTTICVAIAMARKYGWTIGMTPDDNMCPVASLFYGWSDSVDETEYNLYEFIRSMNYANDENSLPRMIASAKQFQLNKGKYAGIVFSPLELGRIFPDLVLVFANSAQIMRLVHAATRNGYSLSSLFSGRFGACNEGILQTFMTGKPQVVIPGNGDRVWGMVQDHEFLFTIPEQLVDEISNGLELTHKAGVRYPIPIDVRHFPNFPPQLKVTR